MKNIAIAYLCVIGLISTTRISIAATITSNIGNYSWTDIAAWSGGVVPTGGDYVQIVAGSSIDITYVNGSSIGRLTTLLVQGTIKGSYNYPNGTIFTHNLEISGSIEGTIFVYASGPVFAKGNWGNSVTLNLDGNITQELFVDANKKLRGSVNCGNTAPISILATSDITLDSCTFSLNNKIFDLNTNPYTIETQTTSIVSSGTIGGTLRVRNNFNGANLTFNGSVLLDDASDIFSHSGNLYLNGDFINYGTASAGELYLNGGIDNRGNGIIYTNNFFPNASLITLKSDPGAILDGFLVNNTPNKNIKLLSDFNLRGSINVQYNDTLILNNYSLNFLKTSSGSPYFYRATVTKGELKGVTSGTTPQIELKEINFSDSITLSGKLSAGTALYFSGPVVLNDTFYTKQFSLYFLNNLINNGFISQSGGNLGFPPTAGSFLYKDFTNNGRFYENLKLTGSTIHHITCLNQQWIGIPPSVGASSFNVSDNSSSISLDSDVGFYATVDMSKQNVYGNGKTLYISNFDWARFSNNITIDSLGSGTKTMYYSVFSDTSIINCDITVGSDTLKQGVFINNGNFSGNTYLNSSHIINNSSMNSGTIYCNVSGKNYLTQGTNGEYNSNISTNNSDTLVLLSSITINGNVNGNGIVQSNGYQVNLKSNSNWKLNFTDDSTSINGVHVSGNYPTIENLQLNGTTALFGKLLAVNCTFNGLLSSNDILIGNGTIINSDFTNHGYVNNCILKGNLFYSIDSSITYGQLKINIDTVANRRIHITNPSNSSDTVTITNITLPLSGGSGTHLGMQHDQLPIVLAPGSTTSIEISIETVYGGYYIGYLTFAGTNLKGLNVIDIYSYNNFQGTSCPILSAPQNNDQTQGSSVILKWNKPNHLLNNDGYVYELSENTSFSNIVKSDSTIVDTTTIVTGLTPGKKYYWHVKTKKNNLYSDWSDVWSFGDACNGFSVDAIALNDSAYLVVSNGTMPYTYSWNNGSTTNYATNLSNGSYTITITDANNCTAIDSVTILTTNAKQFKKYGKQNIVIFPNPNNGSFNIQLIETDNCLIEVLNNLGQVVFTSICTEKNQLLNLDNQNAGIYTIVVKNGNDIHQQKLLITK